MGSKNENKKEENLFEFTISEGKKSPLRACVRFIDACKKGYVKQDVPFIMSPEDKPFKITEDKIFKIFDCEDVRKLGFVDGGNGSILISSDFNVSLNRVAGAMFKNEKWIQSSSTPLMVEFYTVTVLNSLTDGSLVFTTKFFPRELEHREYLPKKDIEIPIKDPSLRRGKGFVVNIEQFGSIARRFAEWTYATKFIENEMEEGDIFVRDGSLQTGYTGEIELANDMYSTALRKKVFVTGLSKTCRLFTKNGDSLISVVNMIANKKFPEDAWYYHPVYQITRADSQADLYFVKLHKYSSYTFRFDIYLEQSKALNQEGKETIISNVANNSKELSFPGYPYGLIKVDQLSRVPFRELEPQRIQLLAEFNKEDYYNYILPRLRSVDAHGLLNNIIKT